MVTTDVMFSEKNEDYRLTRQVFEQDQLYSAQFTLMLNLDPSITVSGTYYRYLGGEGRLGGQWLENEITRNRYELVFAKRARPTGRARLAWTRASSAWTRASWAGCC